ncbi:Ras and Rab interactor 1 Ras inhibitor JC99 Ras interaction/interference protein 1 [Channa argus]|uniref:Ras and Rab interactor 1 Ras inhibitor JC99 Ras interaction/interference protein 1 n=1 Tax=Channa argus TaxID=215402 RepID=A0A6G1QSG0_CHAAH|nr:Ras and Rab interactor 1 Ras inhibitor JC99 Ras interaction/interference protein 1 [Channa argus]KAK2882105.1 hypothetical protein Q8A73_022615 [Channa argus]
MAQQEEPLYDFPEPSALLGRRCLGLQRGRGSLKSINILDRLLLTVPVWLQLTINPATALHILQREPPGTFMVRKSRTSQKSVLCVRLADDSMPSFVQQFGIREEPSSPAVSLETSAISFPDLPRLISFYCVSRDVLPFPLELPEAIAKATSHKELESISHMGIEFWSSHLNVRGPREAPKPQKDVKKKPDTVTPALPVAAPQTSCDSAPQPDLDKQLKTVPESCAVSKQPAPSSIVFQKFCPITTRSPKELDCGSGLGALCFINPLFLQSQDSLSRRRMFQRSVKIRVSTETSTMLSPPLAPPPPPPLMPKTKGRCKVQKQAQETGNTCKEPCPLPCKNPSQVTQIYPTNQDTQPHLLTQTPSEGPVQLLSGPLHFQPQVKEHGHMEPVQTQAGDEGVKLTSELPTVTEHLQDDSEYKEPSPVTTSIHSPLLSPYLCPTVSPMAPPLFPKTSPSLSPHNSPGVSPSLSPRQSPCLSPKVPFSLSPFTSPTFSQLAEQAYQTPAIRSRPGQQRLDRDAEEDGAGADEHKDEDKETNKELQEKTEVGEQGLVLQVNAACLNNGMLCNSIT